MSGGDPNPAGQIRYALDIQNSTAPNSIVFAPTFSAVPLYYSQRHIVRGITNSDVLSGQLPDIRKQFPASPIDLAIPPSLATSFRRNPVSRNNRQFNPERNRSQTLIQNARSHEKGCIYFDLSQS